MLANFNTKWMLYQLINFDNCVLQNWCILNNDGINDYNCYDKICAKNICRCRITCRSTWCIASGTVEDLEEYFLLAALGGDSDSHNTSQQKCFLSAVPWSPATSIISLFCLLQIAGLQCVLAAAPKKVKQNYSWLWAGSRTPWISRSSMHM